MSRSTVPALALLLAFTAPAAAKVEILVDLDGQRMTVTKNGERPVVWKISSGRSGYETPTGSYIVQRMDADHLSDEYDGAPMPYAIFFSRGLAIHGTYERGLGRPASHGCVRLSIDHARELYGWVEQYGASRIEISGAAPYVAAAEEPRRRKSRGSRDGADYYSSYDDFSYESLIGNRRRR
ncbi:MAG TPA: L,D-transpeptidase [Methylocystis sp.]|nr:L,D-transpeptidase [Methylocystis sp.]